MHKPSAKPVSDATIVQTRIDMSPDGLASMASAIVPLPSPGPGVYAFKAPLTMAGRWLLTVSAKVQGEPDRQGHLQCGPIAMPNAPAGRHAATSALAIIHSEELPI